MSNQGLTQSVELASKNRSGSESKQRKTREWKGIRRQQYGQRETTFYIFTAKPVGVSDLTVAQAIKVRFMAGFGNPVRGSEQS
jgi:hypothetical protein